MHCWRNKLYRGWWRNHCPIISYYHTGTRLRHHPIYHLFRHVVDYWSGGRGLFWSLYSSLREFAGQVVLGYHGYWERGARARCQVSTSVNLAPCATNCSFHWYQEKNLTNNYENNNNKQADTYVWLAHNHWCITTGNSTSSLRNFIDLISKVLEMKHQLI